MDELTRLTTLHLRDNKIETLDGFSENMKQLQYVNLRFVLFVKCSIGDMCEYFRANNITDPEELKKLAVLPTLRALVLLGKISLIQFQPMICFVLLIETPISETDSYRMEVLVALDKLER